METPSILSDQKFPVKARFSWRKAINLLLIVSLGLNVYFLTSPNPGMEPAEVLGKQVTLASAPGEPVPAQLLEVKQVSLVSPEHFGGQEVHALHFKVRRSLNHSVCRIMTRKEGCDLMSAYMGRLLVWFLDINKDMRNGDTMAVVYLRAGEPERFKILKLVYKSGQFRKTFEANFFKDSSWKYGSWFDSEGKEIIPRIAVNQSPIKDYTEITSLPGDFRRGARGHAGTDFKAEVGTLVYAPFEGRVLRKNWNVRANGYCIELDHPGQGIKTRYLHLSRTHVKKGQYVKQGEKIGESGNTGKTFAPHLHYEILSRGKKKTIYNPFDFKYHKTYQRTVPSQGRQLYQQTVRLYDSVLQES
ncbi:MAG: M23 family metallopeptidase [Nitrospinaceae bacterium]